MINLDTIEKQYSQISESPHRSIQHAKHAFFSTFQNTGVVIIHLERVRKARRAGLLPRNFSHLKPHQFIIKAGLIDCDKCTAEDGDLLERCDPEFTLEKVIKKKCNKLGAYPIVTYRCDPNETRVSSDMLKNAP
jgi:hypothetical protein